MSCENVRQRSYVIYPEKCEGYYSTTGCELHKPKIMLALCTTPPTAIVLCDPCRKAFFEDLGSFKSKSGVDGNPILLPADSEAARKCWEEANNVPD